MRALSALLLVAALALSAGCRARIADAPPTSAAPVAQVRPEPAPPPAPPERLPPPLPQPQQPRQPGFRLPATDPNTAAWISYVQGIADRLRDLSFASFPLGGGGTFTPAEFQDRLTRAAANPADPDDFPRHRLDLGDKAARDPALDRLAGKERLLAEVAEAERVLALADAAFGRESDRLDAQKNRGTLPPEWRGPKGQGRRTLEELRRDLADAKAALR